jgi:hypothetical protein
MITYYLEVIYKDGYTTEVRQGEFYGEWFCKNNAQQTANKLKNNKIALINVRETVSMG